jgi:transposase
MSAIPIELRERILEYYDRGGLSQQEVADRFLVSHGLVKKLIGL